MPFKQENRHYSKAQLTYLLIFFITNVLNSVVFTANGPLYPPEAMSKGVRASLFGPMMSVVCGAMAVTSLFAFCTERIGLKFCLGCAILCTGLGSVLLGIVHFIHTREIFVVVSVISFAVSGFGNAIIMISIYISCFSVFTGNTSFPVGVIEAGWLTGTCFGPLLTELINGTLGYPATFCVFTILQILNSLAIFLLLPKDSTPTEIHIRFQDIFSGYFEILKFPSVWIFAGCLAMFALGSDFVMTILEPSLQRFNLTQTGVGLMFFASGIPQILSPLWGLILEKVVRPELYLAANLGLMALAMAVLGPIAANYKEKFPTVLGLVLYGLGQGIYPVTAVVNFQQEVEENMGRHAFAVNNNFTAVFYCFVNGLGGLIGPCVAGVLYDQVGFGNALNFPLTIYALLGVIILTHVSLKRCRPREANLEADYEAI